MNRIQSKDHRIGTYETSIFYGLVLITKYIFKTVGCDGLALAYQS